MTATLPSLVAPPALLSTLAIPQGTPAISLSEASGCLPAQLVTYSFPEAMVSPYGATPGSVVHIVSPEMRSCLITVLFPFRTTYRYSFDDSFVIRISFGSAISVFGAALYSYLRLNSAFIPSHVAEIT